MYNYPTAILIVNALQPLIIFLLPAIIFACLVSQKPASYLGLKKPNKPIHVIYVLLLSLLMIPFIVTIGAWIKELNLGKLADNLDEQRNKMLNTYLTSGSVSKMLFNVFLIAFVPAVCEEIFFRGIIQRFAHTFFKRWWLSIGISAFIFTLFHGSITQFVPIMIAGIILGWVYYITSSLWLCILLHFLNNGLQVIVSYFAGEALEKISIPSFVIAFVVLGMCCIFFLLKKSKTPLPNNWRVGIPKPTNEHNPDSQIFNI